MRIWYRSFTDPSAHGAYLEPLQAYLAEIASPQTEFHVVGLTPADLAIHRISELRCACQAIDNAVAAQEQGFDAVLIGHFQDSGLDEARCALDIPVVGLGESSMLHAMQLQPLAEAGAEVIIPAGGLFALLSARERRFRVGDAVVLDPIAVAVRAVETAAWLRAHDGTEASRAGAFAKPPQQAVDELRALVRGFQDVGVQRGAPT